MVTCSPITGATEKARESRETTIRDNLRAMSANADNKPPSQESKKPSSGQSQASKTPSLKSRASAQPSRAPTNESRVSSKKTPVAQEDDPWAERRSEPGPSVHSRDPSQRPSQQSQRSKVPEEDKECEEESEADHRSQYDLYYGVRRYSAGHVSHDADWAPRVEVKDKRGGCHCYPPTSSDHVPSMVYDKITCKHWDVAGLTHKKVFKFYGNWAKPGRLPPIHQVEYVQHRKNASKVPSEYL